MVVKGEEIDATRHEPFRYHRFGVEIVGLLPQVKPGIGGELRPHRLDSVEQPMRVRCATQTGLP